MRKDGLGLESSQCCVLGSEELQEYTDGISVHKLEKSIPWALSLSCTYPPITRVHVRTNGTQIVCVQGEATVDKILLETGYHASDYFILGEGKVLSNDFVLQNEQSIEIRQRGRGGGKQREKKDELTPSPRRSTRTAVAATYSKPQRNIETKSITTGEFKVHGRKRAGKSDEEAEEEEKPPRKRLHRLNDACVLPSNRNTKSNKKRGKRPTKKAKIEETKDEKDYEDLPEDQIQQIAQQQNRTYPKITIDKLQKVKSLVHELNQELQDISDQIYASQPLRPIDNEDSQNYAADDEHTPPFQVDEDYVTPYKAPTDDEPVANQYITALGSYKIDEMSKLLHGLDNNVSDLLDLIIGLLEVVDCSPKTVPSSFWPVNTEGKELILEYFGAQRISKRLNINEERVAVYRTTNLPPDTEKALSKLGVPIADGWVYAVVRCPCARIAAYNILIYGTDEQIKRKPGCPDQVVAGGKLYRIKVEDPPETQQGYWCDH